MYQKYEKFAHREDIRLGKVSRGAFLVHSICSTLDIKLCDMIFKSRTSYRYTVFVWEQRRSNVRISTNIEQAIPQQDLQSCWYD